MRFLFEKDTWQEIYGSIRKNKGRTAITIFGAFWGILLLVGLLGAAKGIENSFNGMFGDFATNSVFMSGSKTSMPFKGFQEGRQINLTLSDVDKIRTEVDGIQFVVPRNATGGQVIHGLKTGNFTVFGDFPLIDQVQKKNLIEGRFINQSDMDENKKICVISEGVYKELYDKNEESIGTYLKVSGINYKVVGVYTAGRFEGKNNVHIPFSTFKLVYNKGDKFEWMVVTGKDGVDIVQLEADVKLLLKNLHKINPDDNRAFRGFNLGERIKQVTGFLTGMQFLTWFVGIATLIAGVFAIGNILLITVKERTKEIGIRRALGATPNKVRQQIILESLFLTLLAGSLGIIGGGLILMLLDNFVDFLVNPTVDIPIVLIAYTVLVVLGTLIGFIPAYMATIVKPIDALREE
ncbi:ABC transporter permease [Polaribacter sp. Z014]|uniref:ABC transporter permease n=1 Tax=unclassified Polaribacter TaxID=196858 RepID=UPI00193BAE7C|nr:MULTISPECIES: ABC transporter permease [unclassified Polaribacter]MCL7763835.1 ABC transporter permease [Polaribacter sp. Z014]QVY66510.1 ABC transporter permease [Polaribacter sp. Q13]